MRKKVCFIALFSLSLIFVLFCSSKVYGISYKIASKNYGKNATSASIWVQNAQNKKRTYTVYKQTSSYSSYIRGSGCGTSCLTTILHAYGKNTNYNTVQVHTILEKKLLGVNNSNPLGLLGMSKILNKQGVSATYVSTSTDRNKIQIQLVKHLASGRPAVVLIKKFLLIKSIFINNLKEAHIGVVPLLVFILQLNLIYNYFYLLYHPSFCRIVYFRKTTLSSYLLDVLNDLIINLSLQLMLISLLLLRKTFPFLHPYQMSDL